MNSATKEHNSDQLSYAGKMVMLLFLFTVSVWILPLNDGVFCSLSPKLESFTISGVVKAAPNNAPIPNATVYSDRELILTDKNGFFSLLSGKNTTIYIEAAGYKKASVKVQDETPVMFLLSRR